jgi:hypothetical protein
MRRDKRRTSPTELTSYASPAPSWMPPFVVDLIVEVFSV